MAVARTLWVFGQCHVAVVGEDGRLLIGLLVGHGEWSRSGDPGTCHAGRRAELTDVPDEDQARGAGWTKCLVS